MKRKFFVVLLAGLLLFATVACGSKDGSSETVQPEPESAETSMVEEEAEPEVPEENEVGEGEAGESEEEPEEAPEEEPLDAGIVVEEAQDGYKKVTFRGISFEYNGDRQFSETETGAMILFDQNAVLSIIATNSLSTEIDSEEFSYLELQHELFLSNIDGVSSRQDETLEIAGMPAIGTTSFAKVGDEWGSLMLVSFDDGATSFEFLYFQLAGAPDGVQDEMLAVIDSIAVV